MRGLSLILLTADRERFAGALAIAAAQCALGARVRLFCQDRAVTLLAPTGDHPEDALRDRAGLPRLREMLDEALALGVEVQACQSGLALSAIAADTLDPRIETGGLVGLLATLGDDRLVAV